MAKSYKGLNVSIISFTRYGAGLSLRLKDICIVNNCVVNVYTAKSDISCDGIVNITCTLKEWTGIHFKEDDIIIFTGACGIAVRSIAPFVESKCSDPAVIVIDDMGVNVISLLSGHLGRANEWTRIIAAGINANPVITTSSDIHKKIAIDLFAAQNNLYIDNMEIAKKIQAAVIEGKNIMVYCDAEIKGNIPGNFYINKVPAGSVCNNTDNNGIHANSIHANSIHAIVISPFTSFKKQGILNSKDNALLHLVPKVITIGTGCRKSKTYNEVNSFIREALKSADISVHAVSDIATIDIKKNETGILQLAEKNKWQLSFYSAAQLNTVTDITSFSGFVQEVTGTGNVCERAALFPQGEKKLILKKQAGNGITVAAAIKKWSVDFG